MIRMITYIANHSFFVMIRRPPRSTRTGTLLPYTTLCRSAGLPDLKPKHLHQLAKGGPARHLLAAQSRGAVVRHVHRRDVADLLTLAIEADVLERHGDARRVTGDQGQDHLVAIRSAERRVGKERVSKCKSQGPPDH